MPLYNYKAYNSAGKLITGKIEAFAPAEVLRKLKEDDLFTKEVTESRPRQNLFTRENKGLPHVTRNLALLLEAGVPLAEALESLGKESRDVWQVTLLEIREKVVSGKSLSGALQQFPSIFPDYYTAMVAAGESGGRIEAVLLDLAEYLEGQSNLRGKISAAMVYPLTMLAVSIFVVSFLFTFIIPKMSVIFEMHKTSLPLSTRILMAISRFFQNYWWVLLAALTCLLFSALKLISKYKFFLDKFLMRLPGGTLQALYYGRFSRILSFLLESGVPYLKALELSSVAVGNQFIAGNIREAKRKISEGSNLSASLKNIPPTLSQLISTGEKTGKLSGILKKAALGYEEEFNMKVQRFASAIEPVFIIIMGLVIGFIAFSVLLPIFQLNQLVK